MPSSDQNVNHNFNILPFPPTPPHPRHALGYTGDFDRIDLKNIYNKSFLGTFSMYTILYNYYQKYMGYNNSMAFCPHIKVPRG